MSHAAGRGRSQTLPWIQAKESLRFVVSAVSLEGSFLLWVEKELKSCESTQNTEEVMVPWIVAQDDFCHSWTGSTIDLWICGRFTFSLVG